MEAITFTQAVKHQSKLRLALVGPAGSGKTMTALKIATGLGQRIAAIDTEHGSMEKYADLFNFDVVQLDSFHPQVCMDALYAAAKAGYDVVIIDSLSHFWMGKDGELELVDKIAKRSNSQNSFAAWRDVTPLHNQLIDSILAARTHVIATMRTKTEWLVEKDERTGKSAPRKVGLAPVMKDSIEFEFDILGELDQQNTLTITKTRCPALSGAVIPKPGAEVAEVLTAWLTGAPAQALPEKPLVVASQPQTQPSASGNGGQKPTGPNFNYIVQGQIRFLMQTCKESNVPEQVLLDYLAGRSIASRQLIPTRDFNNIIEWVKANAQAGAEA